MRASRSSSGHARQRRFERATQASPFATLVHVTEGRGMPRPYGAFCTRRIHATTASGKIGLPVNNKKNTGGIFNQKASDGPGCRACPAKPRSGSFGRNRTPGRRRGLDPTLDGALKARSSRPPLHSVSSIKRWRWWQAKSSDRELVERDCGRWTGSSHGRSLPGLHPGPQPLQKALRRGICVFTV